jgi:hypothetical protein
LDEAHPRHAFQQEIVTPVGQALGMDDAARAGDIVDLGLRRHSRIDTRGTGLEQHHRQGTVAVESVGHHLTIARLEDVQGEDGTGKERRCWQREHRQARQGAATQELGVHRDRLSPGRSAEQGAMQRIFCEQDNARASFCGMSDFESILDRISSRLDAIDQKLSTMQSSRKKSMEWIGQLSEHVRSLDAFREEVRQTLEPLCGKLETIDELMRILRHATSDVARRVESLEVERRKVG